MAKPRISTGTGDDGMTGLLKGERVPKSDLRIHAIGTIDELNAILGVVLTEGKLPESLRLPLERVQRALFSVGADLASVSSGHQPSSASGGLRPASRLSAMYIGELEQWGFAMEEALPSLGNFILPGGSRIAALLHQARAVARRAERWVVGMAQAEHAEGSEHSRGMNPEVRVYLNRLSDCLFLAARSANRAEAQAEVEIRSPEPAEAPAHSKS